MTSVTEGARTAGRPRPAQSHLVGALVGAGVAVGCLAMTLGLAILTWGFVQVMGRTTHARSIDPMVAGKQRQAMADVEVLQNALLEYAILHDGDFPSSLADLPSSSLAAMSQVKGLPTDPWGHPYLYVPGTAGSVWPRVICLGADGIPGGKGIDGDLEAATGANPEESVLGPGRRG